MSCNQRLQSKKIFLNSSSRFACRKIIQLLIHSLMSVIWTGLHYFTNHMSNSSWKRLTLEFEGTLKLNKLNMRFDGISLISSGYYRPAAVSGNPTCKANGPGQQKSYGSTFFKNFTLKELEQYPYGSFLFVFFRSFKLKAWHQGPFVTIFSSDSTIK